MLLKHGKRSEAEVAQIPMVWSGGCDGVITPHATVFARNDKTGPASKSRLAIGTAMSAELLPEDIGRPAMVEKVADAREGRDEGRRHRRSEGRALRPDQDAAADHRLGARRARSAATTSPARCTTRWACRTAPPRSASRSRSARSRCRSAEEICNDLDLYSSVASCSSGVELTQAQIVLLGNKAGAGGRYRIGHAVMKDALDIDGIYDAIRNAGLELPERPRAEDLQGPRGQLLHEMRGRPARHAARAPADHARRFRRAITTAIPRRRSAASRPRRSAIRRCSSRSTPCTRARRAAARCIAIVDAGE